MLIGRENEILELQSALASPDAEMVAVVGRRRVGKTYLIEQVYADALDLQVTGMQHATMREQLQGFALALKDAFEGYDFLAEHPKNWLDAFHLLTQCLQWKQKEGKYVIFLDELPWFHTRKSSFISALGWFWNTWASKRPVVLVICGSAASWMVQKVVNDTGGLHNRITRLLQIRPFDLHETELFLKSRHVNLNRYQIISLYMALGGVPHYLKSVKTGLTAAQNIDVICLSSTGVLLKEFDRLYKALFEASENHIRIVRQLAAVNQGLSRQEIAKATGISDGGGLSRFLEELEISGFIQTYLPFGVAKKAVRYRLIDEYSLFYLRFIETLSSSGHSSWTTLSETPEGRAWAGFSFESLCLKHSRQIIAALGIAGIYTQANHFYQRGTAQQKGVQVDMLIDRGDKAITLCEIKFYKDPVEMSAAQSIALRSKVSHFQEASETNKQLFLCLISPFGLKANEHSLGLIDQVITANELFEARK
jgi:uncharacterized protein